LDYLLFVGYLFLFAWLITRIRTFNQSGLGNTQLVILFLLKIIAGIFYGWVGIYYGYFAYMNDTWGYHNQSIIELNILYTNPHEYFTNLFHSGYESGYGRFFDSSDSYWNDLKSNVFIKLLSLFNILSFGNYYINIIFYSFITLTGPVLLYRVMSDIYKGKKTAVLLATFLAPSFLYWTSGIHKDGIAFTALSLIIYHFHFSLKNNRWTVKSVSCMLLGAVLLLSIRNYILMLMIPALLAWFLSCRFRKRTAFIFGLTYLTGILMFFLLRYISPVLDFPQAVVNKQKAFMQLEGGSGIRVTPLEPTVTGFIKNLPQSMVNVTLRPFPTDIKHMLSLGVATENLFYLFLLFLLIVFRDKKKQISSPHPFIWFSLFFSITFLLSIGYTVNFQGAIVRYRSIIIPFLAVPVFASIQWDKIKTFIFKN